MPLPREAQLEYQRRWRLENKKHIKEYSKVYYAANREKYNALKRQWRQKNQDKVKAQNKYWYGRDRERRLELNKQWRANNKDKMAAWYLKNRAREIARRYVGLEAVDRWLAAFANGCSYCGSHERLEMDHKHPRSRGGTNDEANLQWLCRTCNRSKSDMTEEEFVAHIRLVLDKITRRS